MGLMMCDGKFVSRDEVALVPTPEGTESWKPVSHMEVIEAVTDVVKAHNWQILDENFGLAREGQKDVRRDADQQKQQFRLEPLYRTA